MPFGAPPEAAGSVLDGAEHKAMLVRQGGAIAASMPARLPPRQNRLDHWWGVLTLGRLGGSRGKRPTSDPLPGSALNHHVQPRDRRAERPARKPLTPFHEVSRVPAACTDRSMSQGGQSIPAQPYIGRN